MPSEARLHQLLLADPVYQVQTVDGQCWIEPYNGTLVPGAVGKPVLAIAWLQRHQPWVRNGRQVVPKPLAELQFLRWVQYLKLNLPDPEQSWLRQFLPDGRWLNPFSGEAIAGIVRDQGRLTMDTVRQLAAELRACPAADSGKPLAREILAARLRELTNPSKTSGRATHDSGEDQPTRVSHEPGTGALEPPPGRTPSSRISGRSGRSESRSHHKTTRGGAGDKAGKSERKSTEPSIRVVSGYRILGTLGMGGMSTVYRAVQLSMEREVALKVLDQQGPPDPSYTERFLREARSVGRISHPNVVTCYDVGVHHGTRLYMALELVTGGDSTQLAERHGGLLPERLALGVLRDAARGLGAIHANGLIHRDIKPANLFIAADGSAKLGDLGLVRDTTATQDKYRTMVGIALGTPAFMSPEQSQGSTDLDIRSDIYALGASIFALLVGKPPFEADTVFDLVQRVLNDPVPDVRGPRPELSPITAALLTKAMAKDRMNRYQTPLELQAAAEDALARLHAREQTVEVAEPVVKATTLPPGNEKLKAHGFRLAEVRGRGLIATLGLGSSVLCVATAAGLLAATTAKERLDLRLRQYLAVLRAPSGGQPEATPSGLCRALLVDGLSAAIAQIDLTQRLITVGCTPGARGALVNSKDAAVLTEVSSTPIAIPFPTGSLIALAAGLTGKPFALWGTLVARSDLGAEAVAGHIPLTAEGSTILLIGSES